MTVAEWRHRFVNWLARRLLGPGVLVWVPVATEEQREQRRRMLHAMYQELERQREGDACSKSVK